MSSADGELLPPSTACDQQGDGYDGEQVAVKHNYDGVEPLYVHNLIARSCASLLVGWQRQVEGTASAAHYPESIQE